jgi:hypothetical protein
MFLLCIDFRINRSTSRHWGGNVNCVGGVPWIHSHDCKAQSGHLTHTQHKNPTLVSTVWGRKNLIRGPHERLAHAVQCVGPLSMNSTHA